MGLKEWWLTPIPGTDAGLCEEATKIVIATQQCSVSMLQRKLNLGYARAAHVVDMLEENGTVSSSDGIRKREVLVQPEK